MPLHISSISLHAKKLSMRLHSRGIESAYFSSDSKFCESIHDFTHVFLNWDFNDADKFELFIQLIDLCKSQNVIPIVCIHGGLVDDDKYILGLLRTQAVLITYSPDIAVAYDIQKFDLAINEVEFFKLNPVSGRSIGTFGYVAGYKDMPDILTICKQTNSSFVCHLSQGTGGDVADDVVKLRKLANELEIHNIISFGFRSDSEIRSFLSQARVLLFLRNNPSGEVLTGSSSGSIRDGLSTGLPVFADNKSLYFNDVSDYASIMDRWQLPAAINKALDDHSEYERLETRTSLGIKSLSWNVEINKYVDLLIKHD